VWKIAGVSIGALMSKTMRAGRRPGAVAGRLSPHQVADDPSPSGEFWLGGKPSSGSSGSSSVAGSSE
jgi:hypothetical protein